LLLSGTLEVILPIAGLLVALRVLAWFFRDTWRELDANAQAEAAALRQTGRTDSRPLVAFSTAAAALTVQQYYGNLVFYRSTVRPILYAWEGVHPWIRLADFEEMYGAVFWVVIRVVCFVFVPFAASYAFAPRVGAVAFGLSARNFFRHAWIGAVLLTVAFPILWIASSDPAFARVYPDYKTAGRSGLDLLLWETMYMGQFLALEIFLRGWLLGMLRGLGSGAIFAITVPYCMMHYVGKPYAETIGAIAAGIGLGSLAAKTKSILQGFLIHGAVALMMDVFALVHRNEFPHAFWPPTLMTH
jgi:membrane protease YdiL (CAAX protease family)